MSTEPEREFVGNGRYALDQVLGKGGAGEVVLAYDISLTRWVAIKRIPATDAGIVREAGVLANFQHPNIVTVYDVFQEGGQILIVMEFVQGQTLEELAEAMSGRLSGILRSNASRASERPTPKTSSTATSSREISCWPNCLKAAAR